MVAAERATAAPTFLTPLDMSDPGQDASRAGAGGLEQRRDAGRLDPLRRHELPDPGALPRLCRQPRPGRHALGPGRGRLPAGRRVRQLRQRDRRLDARRRRQRPRPGRLPPRRGPLAGAGDAVRRRAGRGRSADLLRQRRQGARRLVALRRAAQQRGDPGLHPPARREASAPVQDLSVPGQVAVRAAGRAGPVIDDNAAVCWTRSDGSQPTACAVQCSRRRDVAGFPRPKARDPDVRAARRSPTTRAARPTATHAAPLNFASCNPPARSSSVLTVGHSRRERRSPRTSIGSVKLVVHQRRRRTPSPTRLTSRSTSNITDVRNNPSGTRLHGQGARPAPRSRSPTSGPTRRRIPTLGDHAGIRPRDPGRRAPPRRSTIDRLHLHALHDGRLARSRARWSRARARTGSWASSSVKDAGPERHRLRRRLPAHMRRRGREHVPAPGRRSFRRALRLSCGTRGPEPRRCSFRGSSIGRAFGC